MHPADEANCVSILSQGRSRKRIAVASKYDHSWTLQFRQYLYGRGESRHRPMSVAYVSARRAVDLRGDYDAIHDETEFTALAGLLR
jgi:hypothetical protein